MAIKVKKAVLWKRDLENRPGTLAESLKPFADAKQNLQIVMGYAYPGEHDRSALEVYPVDGSKGEAAAKQAGLEPMSHTNCLIVEGDDSVGLAYLMAENLAQKNLNISFSVIQVVSKKFLAIFGFESSQEADTAAEVIKAVGNSVSKKTSTKRKASGKTKSKATTKKATAKKATARKTTRKQAGKKTTAKKSTARKASGKKSKGAKKSASTSKKTTGRKSRKAGK